MEFERIDISTLRELVVWESYCGGSHLGSEGTLRQYIEGKSIDGIAVRGVFEWCGFARVRNVRCSEDALLETETAWNTHAASNIYERPGYVYVLRYRRPMSTGAKVAIGVGVAGIMVVGGVLLNEILKPRVPPPPPPVPPTV